MGQSASSTSSNDRVSTHFVHPAQSIEQRTFFGKLARVHKKPLFHRGKTQPAPLNSVPPISSYVGRERQELAWDTMIDPRLLNHLSSHSTSIDLAYDCALLLQDSALSTSYEAPRNYRAMGTATGYDHSSSRSLRLLGFQDRPGPRDISTHRGAIADLNSQGVSDLSVLLSLMLLSFIDGSPNDTSETSAMALEYPPLPSPPPRRRSSVMALEYLPLRPRRRLGLSTEAPYSFFSRDNDFSGDINTFPMRDHDAQMLRSHIRALRRMLLPENATYEELLMLDTSLEPRPFATTQAAVDENILLTTWSESMKSELLGGEECSICLDTFASLQSVRVLKCRHVFHQECVDNWLCQFCNSCPFCRAVPVENAT